LTPSRHPAVDELGVNGVDIVGTDAEALGDAGTKALNQNVGLGDETKHEGAALFVLEINRHGITGTIE
jgi:hypothetical protein